MTGRQDPTLLTRGSVRHRLGTRIIITNTIERMAALVAMIFAIAAVHELGARTLLSSSWGKRLRNKKTGPRSQKKNRSEKKKVRNSVGVIIFRRYSERHGLRILHRLPCLHMLCMSTLCLRKVAHESCGPDGPRSIPAGPLSPQWVVRCDL